MTMAKINNLKKMKEVSAHKNKSEYGIHQIKSDFSASEKLSSDKVAVEGKRIIRQKFSRC